MTKSQDALKVVCPTCTGQPGERCVVTRTPTVSQTQDISTPSGTVEGCEVDMKWIRRNPGMAIFYLYALGMLTLLALAIWGPRG
jgi:hypothetical protein